MYIQSRNMFDCELKKIPLNLMHKDCMGLPQLELACCWYDPCQQGWEIVSRSSYMYVWNTKQSNITWNKERKNSLLFIIGFFFLVEGTNELFPRWLTKHNFLYVGLDLQCQAGSCVPTCMIETETESHEVKLKLWKCYQLHPLWTSSLDYQSKYELTYNILPNRYILCCFATCLSSSTVLSFPRNKVNYSPTRKQMCWLFLRIK